MAMVTYWTCCSEGDPNRHGTAACRVDSRARSLFSGRMRSATFRIGGIKRVTELRINHT